MVAKHRRLRWESTDLLRDEPGPWPTKELGTMGRYYPPKKKTSRSWDRTPIKLWDINGYYMILWLCSHLYQISESAPSHHMYQMKIIYKWKFRAGKSNYNGFSSKPCLSTGGYLSESCFTPWSWYLTTLGWMGGIWRTNLRLLSLKTTLQWFIKSPGSDRGFILMQLFLMTIPPNP